jgi:hypothetical protein
MSYSPHAYPHHWNQTRMVWLPTGKPDRHGLEVGSKGILPLCPICPIPQTLIHTPGTRPRWSGYQLVAAKRDCHPICPRATKPDRDGLEVGSKGILPLCPISPIPQKLIHTPGTRPGWSGYQLASTNSIEPIIPHTTKPDRHGLEVGSKGILP